MAKEAGTPNGMPARLPAEISNKPTVKNGKQRQSVWEINHAAIRDAYVSLISKLGRRPATAEVAELAQLSYDVTRKHIRDLKFEPIAHPLKVLTDDVLLGIYKSAVDGNAASQKLWVQVMEGWRESNIVEAQVDHTVSDTKFAVKVHKAGTPKE
jgi:hypothetical protein